jgi:hypothetical protein
MSELGMVRQRIRGYWFRDGFQEIAGGVGLSLAGALFLAAAITSNETFATAALAALVVLALVASAAIRSGASPTSGPDGSDAQGRPCS